MNLFCGKKQTKNKQTIAFHNKRYLRAQTRKCFGKQVSATARDLKCRSPFLSQSCDVSIIYFLFCAYNVSLFELCLKTEIILPSFLR